MSLNNCEQVRDLLPELVSGRLDIASASSARAHLETCADCRAELAIAESIAGARVMLPAGLERRVQLATANRRVSYWTRGRMAAVATFAVAIIGGSVLIAPYLESTGPTDAPATVVNIGPVPSAGFIGVEDAFGSGAASISDLTDEQLKQLLAELDS